MSKYKLCEEVGLKVGPYVYEGDYLIKASEVEELLEKGVAVTGWTLPNDSKFPSDLCVGKQHKATHQGILIDYRPLRKKVTREEIATWLHHNPRLAGSDIFNLLKRLESEGLE